MVQEVLKGSPQTYTLVVIRRLWRRPSTINPNGEVRKLSARIPEKVAQELEREAARSEK
jgi:hypothetical protein